MRIWILNHYASTPDQPMTGAYYLAKALVERGHQVRIFASSFSYYKHQELRLKGLQMQTTENRDGIDFTWVRTTPYTGRSFSRLVNMLSYSVTAVISALSQREKPDVVIGTCPHLFGVASARFLAWWRRAKFVFEVRDLWPQTFIDYGILKENSLVTRILQRLERSLCRSADLILTVLPFVYEYMEKLGVPRERTLWIPNGIDPSYFGTPKPAKTDAGPLTCMYLGGHARYQGLDTIIQAAKILQDEGIQGVRFVLVGDGAEKEALVEMAKQVGVRDFEFRAAVPRSEVPVQLNEADVLIFHIKPLPVLRFGISANKLCDYLMAARPIVCAGNLRNNPVVEAEAGIAVPSEDPRAMADAIRQLLALSPQERAELGERGRSYALDNLDSRVLAQRLEAAFNQLLGKSTNTTPAKPLALTSSET